MTITPELAAEYAELLPLVATRPRRHSDEEVTAAQAQMTRATAKAIDLAEALPAASFDPAGFFVYLLFERDVPDRVFYVGQSTNILNRLGAHYSNHGLRIGRIGVIRCSDRKMMDATEKALIKQHKPAENRLMYR